MLADPKAPDYVPELLVVGATDTRGIDPWPNTNSDPSKGLPHVYAAGTGILCPDIDERVEAEYRSSRGTSPGR